MLVLTLYVFFIYMSGFLSQNILSVKPGGVVAPSKPRTGCGIDRLPDSKVSGEENLVLVKSFPWMGLLIHPFDADTASTTRVILITREIALSSALDIDSYRKDNFRARSRVILGHSCTAGPYIRVKEYALHPEYTRGTFSTLAMLQLDTTKIRLKMSPICIPPTYFPEGDNVYALTIVDDCRNSSVMVYKMKHVNASLCHTFYKKAGLDIGSIWPTHSVCAEALVGDHCIWRSGSALVLLSEGRWKLLGIGIYGPGCQSPSRFLDYGMYHSWVKHSIEKIGQPTITRIGPDKLILRKTLKNLPRYGVCDLEESKFIMYDVQTTIVPPFLPYKNNDPGTAFDNVTLLANLDYHCTVLQVWNVRAKTDKPSIQIRRWCTGREPICPERTDQNIYYYIMVNFWNICTLKMTVYGTEKDKDSIVD